MAIRFEWDEAKNRANRKKHGVSFEEATGVFFDPGYVLRFDRVVDGEKRWHAIGLSGDVRLVLVVHTSVDLGEDEVIRLISARKAEWEDQRFYEEQNG